MRIVFFYPRKTILLEYRAKLLQLPTAYIEFLLMRTNFMLLGVAIVQQAVCWLVRHGVTVQTSDQTFPHTYIIGHYNPLVRIDLVSNTTYLYVLIFYISGGTFPTERNIGESSFQQISGKNSDSKENFHEKLLI